MKICTLCKEAKDISLFHLDKKGVLGVKSICKECRRKRSLKAVFRNKSLSNNITRALSRSLKTNKENHYFKYFSFSLVQLRQYLEVFFTDKMTWENFGSYWGIDFIIPKKYFRFSHLGKDEFLECFSLRNMRPLSLLEIRKKQGRLLWEEVEKYKLYDILPDGPIVFIGKGK